MPSNWIITKTTKKGSLGNAGLDASSAATRKAEFYGTNLIIKEDGQIKELTPQQMKKRLAKLTA